jgi:hypothetical protein
MGLVAQRSEAKRQKPERSTGTRYPFCILISGFWLLVPLGMGSIAHFATTCGHRRPVPREGFSLTRDIESSYNVPFGRFSGARSVFDIVDQ